MAVELAYQNPELIQKRQPEIDAFKPMLIEGEGVTTPPVGELSLVLPEEVPGTQEANSEDNVVELKLIVGGLKEVTKDKVKAFEPGSNDVINVKNDSASIIAAFEKTKSGGGSTWSVCDCGCGREAKFGNCANIGYIRLDRRKAA